MDPVCQYGIFLKRSLFVLIENIYLFTYSIKIVDDFLLKMKNEQSKLWNISPNLQIA